MILGITGGSGCGKTTLLNVIRDHGGLVLDCDAIYHQLLSTDTELLDAIRERFPSAFDGDRLVRKKLGSIVFEDPSSLLALNDITHRAVKQEVVRRLTGYRGLAAIDAFALFEGGLAELCGMTIAVTAPLEDRIARLQARDGVSEEYARLRITAQHDDSWFREQCDYVLVNDTDLCTFTKNCIAFLSKKGIIEQGSPSV